MAQRIHRMPGVIPGGKIRQTKQRPSFQWLWWLLFFLFVSGFYWFIFQSQTFAIQKIELTGTDNKELQTLAESLRGKNIFLINPQSLDQEMRQTYPPVGTTSVVRGLPSTVRINIALRSPALRWESAGRTFVLDSEGVVFQESDKPEYASLPKVVDKSGLGVKVGQHVVSRAFIDFVEGLHASLPKSVPTPIRAYEIAETTFHIDAVFGDEGRYRFTSQRPLAEQIASIEKIARAHPEAKIIDVRVPRWGYWR